MTGIEWVPQEHAWGCGAAVLAMVTGDPYWTVIDTINAMTGTGHGGDWAKTGIAYPVIDRYLIGRGFALQRVYRHEAAEWPPGPWAPAHIAEVVQPSGMTHFVAMTGAGVVLDPAQPTERTLTDYPEVRSVVGIIPAPMPPVTLGGDR
jgi:hypothetical protein